MVKCWEVFKCKKKECPVYKSKDLKCWLISGTHCRDEIQGKFLEKMEMCLDCEVFKANMDAAALRKTLKVTSNQFKAFRTIVKDRDKELEGIGLELAIGLSEVFEALKKISSGDPSVRISKASKVELIAKLKHMVNMTAENIGEIVDQFHEFAIGLAEHFDVLHRVSSGDLNARVSGGSKVELLESLKKVTNKMIESISRDITERKQRERELEAIATVTTALRNFRNPPTRADVLSVILDQLCDLLKAEGAALAMHDPVSGEPLIEIAKGEWSNWTALCLPIDKGVSGRVIATGQPYVNDDLRRDPLFTRHDLIGDLHSVACVPLFSHEQPIGTLWIGRKTAIADGEVRVLTAIAEIAANAIYRATLREQTERHLQRLAALHEIDQSISATLDLKITLNIILDQVTKQLSVDAADVLLLNPYTKTLEYAASRGFRSRALQYTKLKLGEGHAGLAALERNIVSIPNLPESENGFKRSPLLAEEGFLAYYSVPLIAKGQVKGVLEVFHRSPLIPNRGWLKFLEALASQAAIAIDNTTLFNDLQRANIDLTLAYDATIEGWSHALDMRDKETEGHSQRATEMTLRLSRAMGMSESELVHVRRGALLHDIGKIGIPDKILLKPGPLNDEEWEIMRKHPVYAYELLSPIDYLRPALDIPYCHHEKWDGTGYPRGLKGEQIPLSARIFSIVDVWESLLSDRPYRPAWPKEKVREYIYSLADTHFDPKVVKVFSEIELSEGINIQ